MPRLGRWLRAALATGAGIVASIAAASPATAAADLPVAAETLRLPPSLQARWRELAVFDVATGRVRPMGGFTGIARADLVAALTRYDRPSRALAEAPLLTDSVASPGVVECDCGTRLQAGEYLVSEQPVRDSRSGRFVSIDDESYKAFQELAAYPMDRSDRLAAAALSELVYVDNGDALRRFLDVRGFDARLLYGFMNGDAYPGEGDVQFAVIGHRATGRTYVAIRGTSGVGDIKTSLRADLLPWAGRGSVHSGFGTTFAIIRRNLEPLLDALAQAPDDIRLTGHSLGGAASVLLAARLSEEGRRVRAITFAAPPIGDSAFAAAYGALQATVRHYLLPGEELEQLQSSSPFVWLHRVGAVELLPDVGRTAGTVHYLINYLRAVLAAEGGDRAVYESGLPVCVIERLPCFAGDPLRRVPICALADWRCLATHADDLLVDGIGGDDRAGGLQALRGRVDRLVAARTRANDDGGDAAARRRARAAVVAMKERLLSERPSPRLDALVRLRLSNAALVAGRNDEAIRQLREVAARWQPAPALDYLAAEFATAKGDRAAATAAIAAAQAADPPPDFAARLAVLAGVWTGR